MSADAADEPEEAKDGRPMAFEEPADLFARPGNVVWGVSALATVAAILSRALVPSMLGVWEGADHVITAVSLAGAVSSQLVALGSSALVIGLVMSTVKSRQPQYMRAFAVGVGMLVLLALSISAIDHLLPSKSRMVVAGSASLLVLLSVRLSARVPDARASAIAFGLVAVGGFVRVACVSMATQAIDLASTSWGTAARAAATVHWALDAAVVGIALAVLTTHPRAKRRLRRPRWALLAVVMLLPLFFSLGVALGADPERTGIVALISNIAHHNQIYPAPFLPDQIRSYLEVLRWVGAAGLLIIVPRSRLVAGALTFALFSRSTLDVPLCAAAAVIGALAIGLRERPSPAQDLR